MYWFGYFAIGFAAAVIACYYDEPPREHYPAVVILILGWPMALVMLLLYSLAALPAYIARKLPRKPL